MTKNDLAWSTFFEETDTLETILHKGFAYVSATDLKNIGKREPRLMAKHDTLRQRPKIFRENNIVLFPVRNGEYVLFLDSAKKSYYEFSRQELEIPVSVYQSKVDLYQFDSYPGSQNFSESQAIDFAFISSLFKTFVGDKNLSLSIRGRMYSGKFDFLLPLSNHKINVSGVQIEVDAGYESPNAIYLLEAKVGRRKDFNIRQLYYPYLEWSHRSKKRIVPIFLAYSHSKYYFYEFNLSKNFGELGLKKSACYSINESPVARVNLSTLLRSTKVEKEPVCPYPQANDLDKIIDLITFLDSGERNKEKIAEYFEFNERQGDYYGNAGRYLGFLKKDNARFKLTKLGKAFVEIRSPSEKTTVIIKQLLKRPTFRKAIQNLFDKNYKLDKINNTEISSIIANNTILTGSTPARRASTVRKWLSWILQNGIFS
ncbi:MAG: hypothetical protein HN922_02850 [Anaerolineae bacterium]|nr:hypothetical protein [Anaerolineae bacterium]